MKGARPLVKGGQGRSAEEQIRAAGVVIFSIALGGMVLLLGMQLGSVIAGCIGGAITGTAAAKACLYWTRRES